MEDDLGWGHPTYISALKQYETFLQQIGHNAEAAEVKAKVTQVEASHRRADLASGDVALGPNSPR